MRKGWVICPRILCGWVLVVRWCFRRLGNLPKEQQGPLITFSWTSSCGWRGGWVTQGQDLAQGESYICSPTFLLTSIYKALPDKPGPTWDTVDGRYVATPREDLGLMRPSGSLQHCRESGNQWLQGPHPLPLVQRPARLNQNGNGRRDSWTTNSKEGKITYDVLGNEECSGNHSRGGPTFSAVGQLGDILGFMGYLQSLSHLLGF